LPLFYTAAHFCWWKSAFLLSALQYRFGYGLTVPCGIVTTISLLRCSESYSIFTGRQHMKKIALGLAVASFAIGGVASARDVRPAAVSLQPVSAQAAVAAPAKTVVAKKNKAAGGALLPILGGIALVGLVVAVASGGDSSPN
jgi:hypothetical protein